MKQKLKALKFAGPVFFISLFLLFFAISPSCGQLEEQIYVIDSHSHRPGHSKAISTLRYVAQEKGQISDVSAKVEHTEDGLKKLIVGLNFQKGSTLRELILTGDVTEGSFELAVETENSEAGKDSVVGYGTCLSSECGQIVIDLFYKSERGNLKHVQTETYEDAVNRPVTYIDEKDVSPDSGRQAEFVTQTDLDHVAERLGIDEEELEEFVSDRPTTASSEFSRYWGRYLNILKNRRELDINPIIPLDSVEIIAQTGGGSLFRLTESPSQTFPRPFNSRAKQEVRVGENEMQVQGILLNGEPLINNAAHCVRWANSLSEYQRVRYAAALLNAVLLYSGNQLKMPSTRAGTIGRGTECRFEIIVNKSANEEGGLLKFVETTGEHSTHQNGLDVDISYVNSEGSFKDVVNGTEVILSASDGFKNLQLIKILYDTGMVNRFIMSPYIKANLVQLAKDEGKLEVYKDALEKIFPFKYHEDHIHLEVVCAAFGVNSNVGCRETDAKHFKWPISSCNRTSCGTEQERVVVVEPEPLPEVVEIIRSQPTQDTSRPEQTTEPEAPAQPAEAVNFSDCTSDQKKALRDRGERDPEGCIHADELEDIKNGLIQNLAEGLELCAWDKWRLSPHICSVRRPLNISPGEQAYLPECTMAQIREISSDPSSSSNKCKHSVSSDYSSLLDSSDSNTELCMWSMHICRATKRDSLD